MSFLQYQTWNCPILICLLGQSLNAATQTFGYLYPSAHFAYTKYRKRLFISLVTLPAQHFLDHACNIHSEAICFDKVSIVSGKTKGKKITIYISDNSLKLPPSHTSHIRLNHSRGQTKKYNGFLK